MLHPEVMSLQLICIDKLKLQDFICRIFVMLIHIEFKSHVYTSMLEDQVGKPVLG